MSVRVAVSVSNMIRADINDRETPARQPITRERTEENISQGFMKKLGKTGNIIMRTTFRENRVRYNSLDRSAFSVCSRRPTLRYNVMLAGLLQV